MFLCDIFFYVDISAFFQLENLNSNDDHGLIYVLPASLEEV